ncbi:MAG: maleylacetoacetate isomerase [Alphaproteobacteria bacterium]|nr:maleylacetoacetate isomerase [Alphaproteobacteria bacterium]
MKLYTYHRSSAAYLVRIAMQLKGLAPEMVYVNLLEGAHRQEGYTSVNPAGLVPSLEVGTVLTQSLAIIEYLEETHPTPPLLPNTPLERARVRAIAQGIACEIHPLNNLRVLKYLQGVLGVNDADKNAWYQHWIRTGFTAIETMLQEEHTGTFCHGDTPTLADICLVPQVSNAQRFKCDLTEFPTILRVHAACEQHPAFIAARPENQKDAA